MESSVVGIGCILDHVTTNGISRVLIQSVKPNGGAADSGIIKAGDILLAVNGRPVDSVALAKELIVGTYGTSLDVHLERSGEQVKGTIWRGGNKAEAEANAKREADERVAVEANSSQNVDAAPGAALRPDFLSVSVPVTQPSDAALQSDNTLFVPAAGTITISEIYMPEFASLVLRNGFVSVSPIFSVFVRKVLMKVSEKTKDDWFQKYFVGALSNKTGEQDQVEKDGPNACWDMYLLCGKIFPRVIHSFIKEEDRLNFTELCDKIKTTRNTWGHIHTDHGLNPQAAVECFNSMKGLIQILQSHAQGHEFGLDFNECRAHIDKLQQDLRTHSVNSEIQIDVFELAVLFNMRACRHFVESMFFKHQLRAFIKVVEEEKLFDFSYMLGWLSKHDKKSKILNQDDFLTRDVSYELARQGRNMVFHGSKNGPQQLLLLMSATLEISTCLMHQLRGEVFEVLDPSEDSSFSDPGEHEEEFKKDIEQRTAEIQGMIRLLLCRVNIQSFGPLLQGASEQQQSSSQWEPELLDNHSAKIRRALFNEMPHQISRCYYPKSCAVVVPEDLQLAKLQEIDANIFKWTINLDPRVTLPVERVFRKFKTACPSKRDFKYDATGFGEMKEELRSFLESCSVIKDKQRFDNASLIDLLQEQLPFLKSKDDKVGLFKRCTPHIPLNTGFNKRLSQPDIDKVLKVYKSRFCDAFKDFLTSPSDQWFELSFSGFEGEFEKLSAVGSALAMLLAMSCHSPHVINPLTHSDAWKNGLGMVLRTQSGAFSAPSHDWCSPSGVKQVKYVEKVDTRMEFEEPADESLEEHVKHLLEIAQIGRNVIPKFTDALVKNAIHSRIDLVAWFRANAADVDTVSASTASSSSSCSSAELSPGWRSITENDRQYFLHVESFTISLEPPKPEFSPGLHRTLCDYLALERNGVNLFNLLKLQLWAMTPQKADAETQTECGSSDVMPSQTGGSGLSGAANQKASRHQKPHHSGGSARS